MNIIKSDATFCVDGHEVSVSFAENKNSTVINQIKQILLSSFLANTSGTITQ